MAGRPPWALGLIALGLALAAAGCSESSSPKAGSSAITVAQGDNTDRGRIGSRIEQAEAAPPTADMSADSPDSTEPPLPSTKRDEKTLRQDHPYRDRHGLANCEIDCSVHEAGYKWAALHSLHDARFCAGRTVAFVDGCRAYVGDHRG